MLCRPRTTETVKTFRLTASRSAGTAALVMTDLRSDQTIVRICREDELYPGRKPITPTGRTSCRCSRPPGRLRSSGRTRRRCQGDAESRQGLVHNPAHSDASRPAPRVRRHRGRGPLPGRSRSMEQTLTPRAHFRRASRRRTHHRRPRIAQLEQKPAQRTRARRSAGLVCQTCLTAPTSRKTP